MTLEPWIPRTKLDFPPIDQREYLGEFPDNPRCETRSSNSQCPEIAVYLIHRENHEPTKVCYLCVTNVIHYETRRGTVVINRLSRRYHNQSVPL